MIKKFMIIIVLVSMQVSGSEVMRLCVDHYPPYQVVYSHQQAEGISVQFVKQLAIQLKAFLNIQVSESFDECLKKSKRGETDFVAGLHASKERAEIFELFRYSDGYSNTSFVTLKTSPNVTQLSDLYNKQVGVITSYQYFADFDDDNGKIDKVELEHFGQMIFQLQSKAVDVIAVPLHHWRSVEHIVNLNGQFKIAEFQQKTPRPVYLGLARNAKWNGDKTALKRAVDAMYRQNRIEDLIEQYYLVGSSNPFSDQRSNSTVGN